VVLHAFTTRQAANEGTLSSIKDRFVGNRTLKRIAVRILRQGVLKDVEDASTGPALQELCRHGSQDDVLDVFDEKAKKALADNPHAAVESCVTDSQRGRELLRCQSAAGLAAFIVNFNGHLNPRLLVHPMFTAVPTPSICSVKAIKIDQIRKKKAAELNLNKNNESNDTKSISNNEALPSSSDRNEGIIGRDSIDSFWSLGNVWHRKVGSKLVADCVESLIGMYFLVGGVPSALALIRSFNMPAVKGWAGEFHSMLVAPRFDISWSNVVTDVENFRREREVKKHHLIQSMAKWSSETLNYKFKNPELLLVVQCLLIFSLLIVFFAGSFHTHFSRDRELVR
jgi:dsRNA-specific ribonuclease